MNNIYLIAQSVVSILLITAILFQNKEGGLGVVGGSVGSSYHTKRGFEKFLTQSTVVLSALFIFLSLIVVMIKAG